MKITSKTLFAALLILSSASLRAQTDSDREFKQIQADRDKAIREATEPITQRYKQDLQTAVEPVNTRYQASLEKLIDRATREADLDTALKAKAALNTLPPVVARQLAGTWALRANTGYAANVTGWDRHPFPVWQLPVADRGNDTVPGANGFGRQISAPHRGW